MPQLDASTFIYQYFGIIFILVIIYTLLSYIALPSLLRIIMIREFFSKTFSSSTIVSNNFKIKNFNFVTIQDKSASFISNNISLLLKNILYVLNITVNYTSSLLINTQDNKLNLKNNFLLLGSFSSYLLFLLVLEDN